MWELYRRLPQTEYVLAVGEHPLQAEFDRSHSLRLTRMPLHLADDRYASLAGCVGSLRAWRTLGQLGRSAGARLTHAASALPEGWLAMLLKLAYGWSYVCYAHGEELKLARTGRMSSRQLRWMTRVVLHRANLVIANSRNTADILRSEWRLPATQVRVLHPGVDTEIFLPAERLPEQRAELGWDNRTVMLTVARLEKRKGHERMIRALPDIRAAVPSLLYSVVGDGPRRSRLEEIARDHGVSEIVQFRGEVGDDELIRCYQQSDLFVLPNLALGGDIEGFGMVLLESQACGTPVVAGASGGTAETMSCPSTGRLVASDDSAELAGTVIDLLSDRDRLHRMRGAAREWVSQGFDWSLLVPEAVRLFSACT